MMKAIYMNNTKTEEQKILVITCFSHFLSHFNMLIFPALVIPLSAHLGISIGQTIEISFWMYLMYGLTALPWGLAADKWGAKPLLGLFFLGSALSCFAAGLYTESINGLALSIMGLGIFSGIYHPAGLGLISKETKKISRKLAFNGVFGSLGIATAAVFAGFFNSYFGLQTVFVLLGLMNLSGLFLIAGYKPLPTTKTDQKPQYNITSVLTPFIILLCIMMLAGICYRGSTLTVPAYFELKNNEIFSFCTSITGLPLTTNLVATLSTTIILMAGILGQLFGGRLAEKFDLRFCYIFMHLIIIPVVFLMAKTANLPLIFLAMAYFFFLLGTQPIENTLVAKLTPKKFLSTAYGLKFIFTFGVGALSVKAIKAIETSFGIESIFTFLGFVSIVLVSVIGLLILATSKQKIS
jgi:MFS family permease